MPKFSESVQLFGPSQEFNRHVETLVDYDIAGRIFRNDMSVLQDLGVASKMPENAFGWTYAHQSAAAAVAELTPPSEADHICLVGMGGASLSARVYALFADSDNTNAFEVIDSIAPSYIADAINRIRDLNALCIVSSKSGGTVETFDIARTLYKKTQNHESSGEFWVVTDPSDSALKDWASANGIKVICSDPDVQGRYSATSVLGMVGAKMLNLDIAEIHRSCERYAAQIKDKNSCESGFVQRFAAAIAHACETEFSELVISGEERLIAIMQWIEQLVAESLGKSGRGALAVIRTMNQAGVSLDVVTIEFRHPDGNSRYRFEFAVEDLSAAVRMFLTLETAVFMAGCLIGVNPLDQNDVEIAKQMTRESLASIGEGKLKENQLLPQTAFSPLLHEDPLALKWLKALKCACAKPGYTAVLAYLSPIEQNRLALEKLTEALERTTGRTAVHYFGPQYLHSTGQFHKGGPPQGTFLCIQSNTDKHDKVDERAYSFGELLAQQANADARVLKMTGREVFVLVLSGQVVSDLNRLTAEILR